MTTADTILRKNGMPTTGAVPKIDIASAPGASAAQVANGPAAKRIALIGAGFIATAHADALKAISGTALVGVVDPNTDRAAALARRIGSATAAASLAEMLDRQQVDAVHVLTPPNLHVDVTREALSRGVAVLLEKPMASEIEGAESLVAAASAEGAPPLYINHNFIFHPAFMQLSDLVKSGRVGKLISLTCTFAMPLRQLSAGQLQHWMFRRPANLLLEQAVHPLSQIMSLTGPVLRQNVLAGAAYDVGSPSPIPRTLSISLSGQNCEAQVYLHFGSTFPTWQITALCTDGLVKADMVGNRIVCEQMSENLEPLDNFIQAKRVGGDLRRQTRAGLVAYGRALLGLGKRSDSFFHTMTGSIGAFYRGERPWVNTPEGARDIVRLCEGIAAEAFPAPAIRSHAPVQTSFKPDAVVLGGTGFIGHHIVNALAAKGMRVAAVSRAPVVRNNSENVRFLYGDMRNATKLAELIGDAPFLINAAGPEITESWADCERKVQNAVTAVSDACRQAGVKRLIHLSSIAALYLGNKGEIITGKSAVDPYGWKRANYSRAKGLEENALLKKFEEGSLPVSILRPAVVVGEGGTPFHTGVGLFNNERHCMGWDDGRHPLPFVLGEDVASAVLAATEKDGILGRCYNLAGDVQLSAREYIEELAKATGRPIVFHAQSPGLMYFSELGKWALKRIGGRKVAVPSKRDLLSRAMAATMDCSDVKAALNWVPVSDRETFLARSILVHTRNN
jgi:predicted dehydrogenase/nucleoside-diphosphate-sugar epimerase